MSHAGGEKVTGKQKALPELERRHQAALVAGLEALLAPEAKKRARGLQALVAIDAHRRSPVAAALLCKMLDEPDLRLRSEIVDALADMIGAPGDPIISHERARDWARAVLGEIRQREIFALVQVAAACEGRTEAVCRLLAMCPFSGPTLVRILGNPSSALNVRAKAATLIGMIGYIEAAPILEKLAERLSQSASQVPLAGRARAEAEGLLPEVLAAKSALAEAGF